MRCPADLTPSEYQTVRDTAVNAFHAMGLRDFARIDFRYENLVPYIIDINEIPDLDRGAGFAYSAIAGGYTYESLVEKLLDTCLRRGGWRK
jgi:D-alanine-D-alanine ligase